MLGILNESSNEIPWKVDYLFTAVVLKLKKCPKSGYWISVNFSTSMKASCWLQLVRRYFGMLGILNESSTEIPWKVDYLLSTEIEEVPQKWILNFSTSLSLKKSCWLPGSPLLRYVGYIEWILNFYLLTVLKLKKCPKSGYWISVHWLESCTLKASCWLQLVRRDFGMLDILNESSTKIPWKVDYLLTAVELKLKKCPKSGYWISVHRLESCTLKASCWLQLVGRDFGMLDILNESSTKIPWKVDYLLTAVELKLKKCPKSGYWVSVHRFQSCTMKASVWLQLVQRDFGMLDIMNESCTKIPWKVDYLFTAVVLKLKKCPKSGHWISVHWFESCTMKASVRLQLVRSYLGMLGILNESSNEIPWKVDYLFTGYLGMLGILNESSNEIPWKVDYLFTEVVLKLKKCPKSGYWISVHRLETCTMKA